MVLINIINSTITYVDLTFVFYNQHRFEITSDIYKLKVLKIVGFC